MDIVFDDQIKISLGLIGIYLADLNTNQCYKLVNDYVKNCQQKIYQDFPIFNTVCSFSAKYCSASYSLKVMSYSRDEYAVVSFRSYSIFKVLTKNKLLYKLLWKSKIFDASIKEINNIFQVTINQKYVLDIQIVDISDESCLSIPFTNDDTSSNDSLNSILDTCLLKFNNILNGYVLPEPIFSINLNKELELMFSVLRDPLLPSLQFQSLLENNEATIPNSFLNELQQIIAQYTSNYSSLFSRFPSTKIFYLVNTYLDSIGDQNTKYNMSSVLRPILELAEMFSSGIRGNAKYIIETFLDNYRKVEVKFQNEDDINNMNIVNRPITASDVFSHNCLTEKNKLILTLIENLERYLPGLIMDLKPTIHKLLNSLSGIMYSQVVSKLREILITGQVPSYEVRKNEIESIFLNSNNRYSNSLSTGGLESLIFSNSEMFDIISDFFYHKIIDFRKCALEVYIRRAYMAYDIQSFKQSQLSTGQLCVIFQFKISNISSPKRKRSSSFVAFNNNPRNYCIRKSSHFPATEKISPFYLDKDDISEACNNDLSNEYNFMDDKPRDNDTDSAISIGAHSLSEISATVSDQVEFDSIIDNFPIQYQASPSFRSLEEISMTNIKSNQSLDNLTPYKWKRNYSIFSNQLPLGNYEDFNSTFRTGIMLIFDTIEELDRDFKCLSQLLEKPDPSDYLEYDYTDHKTFPSTINKIVINVVFSDSESYAKSDENIVKILKSFCVKNKSYLCELDVSRITFLFQTMEKSLRYFTFRKSTNFEEDVKVRLIDPALSSQLEIDRLQNYQIERLPVLNRRMYVYLGKFKHSLQTQAEYRMFVRCTIHHNDINSSTTNVESMAKEAERSLLEAMDAFDIAYSDGRANLTSYNHIFFYFNSILCINKMEDLESVVRCIVLKYGRRLWSLRITQAELKLSVKFNNDSISVIPIRLWVHNEGGKGLDIFVYKEEFVNLICDHKCLISWSSAKEGCYHGLPVDCFYSI